MAKINAEALSALKKNRNDEILKSRAAAVLGKKQNPSWHVLMDHIGLVFTNFEGIRGYYNIISEEWVFVMTDVGRAHEMLRDALIKADIMKYTIHETAAFEWKEPIDWVAFTIGNRAEYVTVRSTYYTDDSTTVDLTPEKKAAIEYRIREEAIPKLRAIMDEEYPYHIKPRVISSFDNTSVDIQNLYDWGERYFTTGQGNFSELVYRLKGKNPLESVIEFDEWLEEEREVE